MKRSPHVEGGRGPEDHSRGIQQKEIGIPKIRGLNCAENLWGISPSYPAENIVGGEIGIVEKVGDVTCTNAKVAKAMKEVGAIAWAGTAGNVMAPSIRGHRGSQGPIRGNGRGDLRVSSTREA